MAGIGGSAHRGRVAIRMAMAWLMGGMTCLMASCASLTEAIASTVAIEVQTEDVERFYRIYEAADGLPTAFPPLSSVRSRANTL